MGKPFYPDLTPHILCFFQLCSILAKIIGKVWKGRLSPELTGMPGGAGVGAAAGCPSLLCVLDLCLLEQAEPCEGT